MPRYESSSPEGRAIRSVKLDGREVMRELLIRTADTDEGWLEVYEVELDLDGKKHVKMTPWRDESEVGGEQVHKRQVRDFVIKRLTGKVEVSL